MQSSIRKNQSRERQPNEIRCVAAAVCRDLPYCVKMLAEQPLLRTKQPFPYAAGAFDGKSAIQGPNLTSIVCHGPHDDPVEVDFHQKHPANSILTIQQP